MSIVNKILKVFVGDKAKKDVQELQPIISQIKSFEEGLKALSHDELRAKTTAFKERIADSIQSENDEIKTLEEQIENELDVDKNDEAYQRIDQLRDTIYKKTEDTLNELLPEAFAVVKETARRFVENDRIEVKASSFDIKLSGSKQYVQLDGDNAIWETEWDAAGTAVKWDMIHYDVQLIGGMVLHQGKIAEMQTGEGKTLVATLPVYLNALAGQGVHLVTVNDYLAKRDSAWMAPLFEFHGLSVDCIDNHQPNSEGRRAAYLADITYGTNNEFGFDYLRDNMAHNPSELVQRPHHYAIVDEVDSVLIDDARTPLIISGPVPHGDRHEFNELKPKVADLVAQQRKYLNGVLAEAKKLIAAGDTKEGGFLLLRVHRGLPKNKALIKFLSEEGIKMLLQKTENFYMQDNNREMHQVDEELYFTIDEKTNQVELTEKGVATISDEDHKDFFVLPDIGSEIAAIESQNLDIEQEAELKDELFKDFGIKSERIHTLTQLFKAYTLFEKDIEYVVMDNKVLIVDEQTGRIMDGRRYSDGLHQAIEAKENVKIEAMTQTYATVTLQNYFRMYRKLSGMTGTAITEAGEFWEIYELDVVEIPTNRPIARADREDLIYKTKREKYNAVGEEVVKLSREGRPVLIGTTSVEISELLSRMLTIQKIPHNVLNAKLHKKEADIVSEAGKEGMVTIATNMAGRGTDIKLSDAVKKNGGLAIIGTERHDSRRVDRQLRGRSGRQGDPGSSQFYVSLEDNLMRLFGSDRVAKLMDRMGLEEGEVIQHSMMTKSIERAQKKVEENNFGIRKNLLEYDDVMNTQRNAIYKRRNHALLGERLSIDIDNAMYDVCADFAQQFDNQRDEQAFKLEVIKHLAIEPSLDGINFAKADTQQIAEHLYQQVAAFYEHKWNSIQQQMLPSLRQIYNDNHQAPGNIVVPFTDGIRGLQIYLPLQESIEQEGKTVSKTLEKNITLALIDDAWKDHLRGMDDLRQSVRNATYEQKDPLLIYKFEAFKLFQQMMLDTNKTIISFLMRAGIPVENGPETVKSIPNQHTDMSRMRTEHEQFGDDQAEHDASYTNTEAPKRMPIEAAPKIGRNDVCPCGSGKKFKSCHGRGA